MARRKNVNGFGLTRPALGLVGAGLVLGVGSSVLGKVGGSTATAAQGGLTTFASFTPVIATGIGSFIVIRQLQNLQAQVESQTRRRRRIF